MQVEEFVGGGFGEEGGGGMDGRLGEGCCCGWTSCCEGEEGEVLELHFYGGTGAIGVNGNCGMELEARSLSSSRAGCGMQDDEGQKWGLGLRAVGA